MEQIIDEAAVSRFENETWSRCADSYPETFHLLTGRTIALLVRAAGIRAGTRVLDLGAGPGDGTAMLAETGAAVAGVDFSRTMVAAARRRHPGLTFHEGDAEVLPFADGVFDAIVSNFVVHHLARPALVFREVSRVLAPGGALFVFRRHDTARAWFQVPGHPWTSAFFVAACAVTVAGTLYNHPVNSVIGFLILAAGVPACLWFRRRRGIG